MARSRDAGDARVQDGSGRTPTDRRSVTVGAQEDRLQKLHAICRSRQAGLERVLAPKSSAELETITGRCAAMRAEDAGDG